jgi:glycosyltransferase involved in cell wall biosynthesis
MGEPTVAIVHDYLTQRGGAERVLLSMCKAFPKARVLTSVYSADTTYPEFLNVSVETSPLNRVPAFRRDPRLAFPVLSDVFRHWQVEADVVLVSSSGWAHGIRTHAPKVVYCYNPPRWLYQRAEYVSGLSWQAHAALSLLAGRLERHDKASAAEASAYVTSSTVVQERIRKTYGIDADLLPPPVVLSAHPTLMPVPALDPGFFLTISRSRVYKNVNLICEAMTRMPEARLVVVGPLPTPPDGGRWPSNVVGLGRVSDHEMRWLYSNATAVVAAAHEDFGLSPLEGNLFGTPAIVLRAGGFLDTVIDGETGLFFDVLSVEAIVAALQRVRESGFDEAKLKAHAKTYGEERFIADLQARVRASL